MGLLLSHKRKLRIWPDMLSVSGYGDNDRSGGGYRGEIQVFSAASRYRLFRQLHTLEFEKVTFLTLTYPAAFPTEISKAKANLKEWRRRFEEKYGKARAIWRLEFQKRGAPHFHIMYLDIPFIEVSELCYLWKSVCHTYDMAHELTGVDLKMATDNSQQKLIASYLGKYIAKIDERPEKTNERKCGRWWGRWNIKDTPPLEFEITDRAAERIVTLAISHSLGSEGWQPIDPTICTVFGNCMGSSEFGLFARRLETYTGGGDF